MGVSINEGEASTVLYSHLSQRSSQRCCLGCRVRKRVWQISEGLLTSSFSSSQEQPRIVGEEWIRARKLSKFTFLHPLKTRQAHYRGSEFHLPGKPSQPGHQADLPLDEAQNSDLFYCLWTSFVLLIKELPSIAYTDMVDIIVPILQVRRWRPRRIK